MLKVDFLSALNNLPLLNFRLVSSREKICFIGWFSVAFTIHCENRKHILKIEKYGFYPLSESFREGFCAVFHKIYTQPPSLPGKEKSLHFSHCSWMWILISRSLHTESITSRYQP